MIFRPKGKPLWGVALTLPIAFVATFYGFLNYWQAIEAPDSKNRVLTIILLLPVAALSTFFRAVSPNSHLSVLTYRLVLILGTIGQFLYYYGILALICWLLKRIKVRRLRHRKNGEK